MDLTFNQLHSSIFKYHFDPLFNYGVKISGDEELVKDSIQELFFRMWKNNIDFSTITYLKAYLFKALRRQILNSMELKYNRMDKTEIEDHICLEFSPEDYFIKNQDEEELRSKILHALNSLPLKQREAIYLRYFEELEYDEIAEIMHINSQSVKNNVHRGLDTLRDSLTIVTVIQLFGKLIQ
jgi:RNA polymerase sigma factor (sigma-70 family)